MHQDIQANDWQVFITGDPLKASAVDTCIYSGISFLSIQKRPIFQACELKANFETTTHLHDILNYI